MGSTITKHIECRDGVCGGKPCVAGTRIRVWDIYVWHDLRGQSPEEIVALVPQLTVADVHAAIAYYLDHREAMERQAEVDQSIANQMEVERGPTRFSQLRDELLKGKSTDGSSVSSG